MNESRIKYECRRPKKLSMNESREEFLRLCAEYRIRPEHESTGLLLLYHLRKSLGPHLPEAIIYHLLTRHDYERNVSPLLTHQIGMASRNIRKTITAQQLLRSPPVLTETDRFKILRDCKFPDDATTELFFSLVNKTLTDMSNASFTRRPQCLKATACHLAGFDLRERRITQRKLCKIFGISETTIRKTTNQVRGGHR